MFRLCFMSNLTSSEWAAWVQAIGSIIAILGAAGIAVWQARKQYKNALAIQAAEKRHEEIEKAKNILALARNCSKTINYITDELNSPQSIYMVAKRHKQIDLVELLRVDAAIRGIPDRKSVV